MYLYATPTTSVKAIPTPKAHAYLEHLAERVRVWSHDHGQIPAFNCAVRKLNRRIGYRADPSRRDIDLYAACVERLRFQTGL